MKRYTREFKAAVLETVQSRIDALDSDSFKSFLNEIAFTSDMASDLNESDDPIETEAALRSELKEELENQCFIEFQDILEMDEWLHTNALSSVHR